MPISDIEYLLECKMQRFPFSPCEGFAQRPIGDSVTMIDTEGFAMVDRVLGQLSLADSVAASDETIFDLVAREIDWQPITELWDRVAEADRAAPATRR